MPKSLGDSVQVPDAIARGILKAARIDVIDYGAAPPRIIARHALRSPVMLSSTEAPAADKPATRAPVVDSS
jgi:hypothetical protein